MIVNRTGSVGSPDTFLSVDEIPDLASFALDLAESLCSSAQPALTVRLPKLRLSVYGKADGYFQLVQDRLVRHDTEHSHEERYRLVLASPQDTDIPPPPMLGPREVFPRDIENLLAPTPVRAAFQSQWRQWQFHDRKRNLGIQWMAGPGAHPPWETGSPLRTFLHWIYSARGMRVVHAGTLGLGGRGVLIAGPGGTGKSGTVLSGLMNGMESVGDDYVLVETAGEEVRALSLYQSLKQDAAGIRRLRLEDRIAPGRQLNWQDKYEFVGQDIDVDFVPDMAIAAIMIPSIARCRETNVVPISPSRAMLALAPSGLFQSPGERDSGVDFFSRLVRRLPSFGVRVGHDPSQVAEAIGRFLEKEKR